MASIARNLLGMVVLLAIAFVFYTNRRAVKPGTIVVAQFLNLH